MLWSVAFHTELGWEEDGCMCWLEFPSPVKGRPPYWLNWMARGMLLLSMHRAGVTRLSGCRGTSVADFSAAFPDACHWMKILTPRDNKDLATFFRLLEYDGRPEFFSFWTCLLLTKLARKSPECFDRNADAIQKHRVWYRRTYGIDIVPVRCIQQVARNVRNI